MIQTLGRSGRWPKGSDASIRLCCRYPLTIPDYNAILSTVLGYLIALLASRLSDRADQANSLSYPIKGQ